jgi:hypothetical protein
MRNRKWTGIDYLGLIVVCVVCFFLGGLCYPAEVVKEHSTEFAGKLLIFPADGSQVTEHEARWGEGLVITKLVEQIVIMPLNPESMKKGLIYLYLEGTAEITAEEVREKKEEGGE